MYRGFIYLLKITMELKHEPSKGYVRSIECCKIERTVDDFPTIKTYIFKNIHNYTHLEREEFVDVSKRSFQNFNECLQFDLRIPFPDCRYHLSAARESLRERNIYFKNRKRMLFEECL